MANPLNDIYRNGNLSNMPQNNGINEEGVNLFNRLMNNLNNSQNQEESLMKLAQMNPQFSNVIQMCNGMNPKDVFISECQKRGIDAQALISRLNLK